jgi:hypothetical protein
VAAAAYRARARLEDERYGKVHDYSRRGGLEFAWHAAPAEAPEWAKDVGQAWNAVERVEVRKNSTLAFDYDMAFPHQLNAEQREWMLKDWVREGITRKGLIVTAAIHAPDKDGDQRNFHAHVMFNDRPVDENGFARHKDRSVQRTEFMLELRERWAELGARQLERAGYEVEAERWRHGHKSLKQQEAAALERGDLEYAEQVRDREPTTHVGHVATAIERKGRVSERGEINREVEARNAERKEIEVDLAAVREELERLVAEPDDERVEVDSSPDVGEQRRSNERQAETAERLAEERELAAAAIKAAWQGAERDPVSFVIALGEQGLTLAENERGRFVAVDERGAVHGLSGAALGEKPWEVQRELQLAFKSEGSVQLPGVAEVREELREAREAERAEDALGWAAHRRAEARERAVQWETNREIWKEQRALDRQIDRVEAAQERPQSAAVQAIGRAYAESSTGAELVEELEWRGFLVCRVSAEEAERSRMQRAVLGTTASYQEGEVLAVTERGQAYRINAETIAMTATNTYDHVQNVAERLASIEPQAVMSWTQAQEVVTQNANERGSIPIDRFEAVPSAWEVGRVVESGIDAADAAAVKGLGAVTQAASVVALGIEAFLFGGPRKAPGGAEYEPPAAAGPPPPVAERPPWLEKQEKLRTTSGVEATQDPAAKAKVEEKQGQSFAEQWEEMRRRNEKAARERAELYREREEEDRDRER